MKKPRVSLFLGMLVVLGLMTGCYREAAPDVTATAGVGAEGAPSEEGMPDVVATAQAESARATEMALGTAATETVPAPSATPTATTEASPTPTTPTPTPSPTSSPTAPAPTSTPPAGGTVTHIVQRGENLFRIALRYNTTVQAIANANSIANPALIYAGQKLVIQTGTSSPPSPVGETTYVVKAGDNLFRIALRYNMNYLYLAQYNGITNPSSIYAGQVLRIPPR